MHDSELIRRAGEFHPWDAMSPAALGAILARGPFRSSAETGCGGSTIILSHASDHHTAFAIEGENRTVSEIKKHPDFRGDKATFVEGETRVTLPGYKFDGEIDLALLDGPHAYPLPQLELTYLLPRVRVGGWLVVDDIQIPSVHEIFRFLRKDDTLVLEEVAVRTALFRRTRVAPQGPDGWELQGMNRHTVLRYSWRDRLRKLLR